MEDRTTVVSDMFHPEGPLSFTNRPRGADLAGSSSSSPSLLSRTGEARDTGSAENYFFPFLLPALAPAEVVAGATTSPRAAVLAARDDSRRPDEGTTSRSGSSSNQTPINDLDHGVEPVAAGAITAPAVRNNAENASAGPLDREEAGQGAVEVGLKSGVSGHKRHVVGGDKGLSDGRLPRSRAVTSRFRPLMASFFAVYDGHDGDEVAKALHQNLHRLLAKQVWLVLVRSQPCVFVNSLFRQVTRYLLHRVVIIAC